MAIKASNFHLKKKLFATITCRRCILDAFSMHGWKRSRNGYSFALYAFSRNVDSFRVMHIGTLVCTRVGWWYMAMCISPPRSGAILMKFGTPIAISGTCNLQLKTGKSMAISIPYFHLKKKLCSTISCDRCILDAF